MICYYVYNLTYKDKKLSSLVFVIGNLLYHGKCFKYIEM